MRIDIKTFLILALTITVIVLSTCNSCKQKKIDKLAAQLEQCKSNDQQGKVERDTVYIHDSASFVDHAPIPQQTEPPQMAIKRIFDTLYLETAGRIDTVYVDTLIDRFYSKNYYSKKYVHKYGAVTTFDTTFQNKLLGQGLNIDLSLPSVTNTVYKPIRKAQFYVGVDAFTDRQFNLMGAGANVLFVSKRALAYQIGSYFTDKSSMNFRASIMFPLTKK